MPTRTANLHSVRSDDDDGVGSGRTTGGRRRTGKARTTGIVLLVGMMGGIVVNATLLQTAHVSPIVVADDTDADPPARPAPALAAQVAPAAAPVELRQALAEPAPDMTPTGSIPAPTARAAPHRDSARPQPRHAAPVALRPKPAAPVKVAVARKPDAIAAYLKSLGAAR